VPLRAPPKKPPRSPPPPPSRDPHLEAISWAYVPNDPGEMRSSSIARNHPEPSRLRCGHLAGNRRPDRHATVILRQADEPSIPCPAAARLRGRAAAVGSREAAWIVNVLPLSWRALDREVEPPRPAGQSRENRRPRPVPRRPGAGAAVGLAKASKMAVLLLEREFRFPVRARRTPRAARRCPKRSRDLPCSVNLSAWISGFLRICPRSLGSVSSLLRARVNR